MEAAAVEKYALGPAGWDRGAPKSSGGLIEIYKSSKTSQKKRDFKLFERRKFYGFCGLAMISSNFWRREKKHR